MFSQNQNPSSLEFYMIHNDERPSLVQLRIKRRNLWRNFTKERHHMIPLLGRVKTLGSGILCFG